MMSVIVHPAVDFQWPERICEATLASPFLASSRHGTSQLELYAILKNTAHAPQGEENLSSKSQPKNLAKFGEVANMPHSAALLPLLSSVGVELWPGLEH
jgi:hypothetical protein